MLYTILGSISKKNDYSEELGAKWRTVVFKNVLPDLFL
jgi:hypothetical protein